MTLEARCYSNKCAPSANSNTKYAVKVIPLIKSLCPDCGHAVQWGKPGRRRRDEVSKARTGNYERAQK